jgi:hypothetical protein
MSNLSEKMVALLLRRGGLPMIKSSAGIIQPAS